MIVLLSAIAVPAAEWYWVNDAGGTWDEAFGGVTSWRDSGGNPGIPSILDDALLVLPYSDSFCNPDGCNTQPVVVSYRSDTNSTLDEVIIESENYLVQQEGIHVSLDQLDLTSNIEIVGGSGRVFGPPPSFPLPDPPGIFPEGRHLQWAGTNTVNDHLVVGGISGSTGRYELSGTAVLDVGGYEVIGDAGQGQFSQLGGTHTTTSLILGQRADSDGDFDLDGGSLEMTRGIIGAAGDGYVRQTGGIFEAEEVVLGRDTSGYGTYHMEGGSYTAIRLFAGEHGYGHFYQESGTTAIDGQLHLGHGEGSTGLFTLLGGSLTVGGLLDIGLNGDASFVQAGDDGVVTVYVVAIGTAAATVSSYYLRGGTLNVAHSLQLGGSFDSQDGGAEASFIQSAGVHNVTAIRIGDHVHFSVPASYHLEDGSINAITMEIQRNGTFEQSGGVNTVAERMELGRYSHYTLNDGTLNVGDVLASRAELNIRGMFSQTGASSRTFVYGDANIDYRGPCTLTDGSFQVSDRLTVGLGNERPLLTIQGSDVNVGELYVAHGLVEMTGGHLVVQETFAVRALSSPPRDATFHQTGGIVDARGHLVVEGDGR